MPSSDAVVVPPVARAGADVNAPYGWISEPTPELIDLLDAERAYYEARTAPLAQLRATLAAEMAARVPDRSESAPWRIGGFTYREVHNSGAEYPALVRRTGTDGPDEQILDLQAVADAHPGAEFHRGDIQVSPDGGRWRGRTTSSATSGTDFDSATSPRVRIYPVSSKRPSPPEGGAPTRRPTCTCGSMRCFDRTRCGHTGSGRIRLRMCWCSPSPTSGSTSAWRSPAPARGS